MELEIFASNSIQTSRELNLLYLEKAIGRAVVTCFCAVLFLAIFYYTYVHYVVPIGRYLGYDFRYVSFWGLRGLAMCIVCVLSLFLPTRITRPSAGALWMFYLLLACPMSFMPFFVVERSEEWAFFVSLSATLSLAILSIVPKLPLLRIKKIRISQFQFWFAYWSFAVICLLLIIINFPFSGSLISWSDITEIRQIYNIQSAEVGRLPSYAFGFMDKFVTISLIALGLFKRSWLLVLIGLVGKLFIFQIHAGRSSLLGPLFLIVLFFGYKIFKASYGRFVLLFASVGLLLSIYLDRLFESGDWLVYMAVQRFLATPALITTYFFDFFSSNQNMYFSDGFLSGFVDNPYGRTSRLMVGYLYFGDREPNATVSYLGDAFAQLGSFGIPIITLILGLVLWLFDSVSAKDKYKLGVGFLLMGYASYHLCESSLTTTLLTHSLGLSFLFIYLMPKAEGTKC